jgi:hypothetical protein
VSTPDVAMSDILQKISSYNIFNYLFPGAIFAFACEALNIYRVGTESIILALFTYYFIGLTISRIGSVLFEPFLKRVSFVRFAPYADFIRAEKTDDKLQILVEVSNTYRTLASMCVCIFAAYGGQKLIQHLSVPNNLSATAGLLALTCLYFFSYRKQVSYVRNRIEHQKHI